MEVEVVQETPFTPHSEHSYSKLFDSSTPTEEEKMDVGGSPSLAPLDEYQDTFETFLLLLLKSFTSQQCKDSAIMPGDHIEISAEALDTLSSEQVQILTTSSSVTYDAINQIRQRQHAHESSPSKQEKMSSEPPDSNTPVASSPTEDLSTAKSQLQQIQSNQIAPEQLKQLELEVTKLLQSQKVVLPTDITPEQQQEVIQALLLRQLRLQQVFFQNRGGEGTNTGGGSAILGLLQGEGEALAMDQARSEGVQGQAQSEGMQDQARSKDMQTEVSTGTQTPSTSSSIPTPPAKPPSIPPAKPHSIPAAKPSSTRGRKREQDSKKEPKKPSMPYNLFFSEVYSTVLAANPKMGFSEASKIISMMWNAMGSDAKQRYFSKHEELKQEYRVAMEKHLAAKREAEVAKTEARLEAANPVVTPAKLRTRSDSLEERFVDGPVEIKMEPNTARREDTQQETWSSSVPKDPKLCVREGCTNTAIFVEERGPKYCSNECVVEDCRNVFNTWSAQRKVKV